jgi:RNA ligase (TIGR02306 family)
MYKNGERCMAWVAKIDEVTEIPNADAICAYRVGGWWVVDKKNAYNTGDLCVYVSIDSWVPHAVAPFLSKGQEPREFNGVKGERLRSIRLRGQISQGLLLKLEDCFDIVYENGVACINTTDSKTTRSVNDSIQDNQ